MIGALFLGLFCGIVARILVPNDAFRNMSGPRSWLVSLLLGLAGALVGYLLFTVGLGIGDNAIFDWGGVISALIGTLIVLPFATLVLRRTWGRPSWYQAQRVMTPGLRWEEAVAVPVENVRRLVDSGAKGREISTGELYIRLINGERGGCLG
jgi:uncharacterized membrane protein YeaQ/YmgE (transglycosylase-associated protein family)